MFMMRRQEEREEGGDPDLLYVISRVALYVINRRIGTYGSFYLLTPTHTRPPTLHLSRERDGERNLFHLPPHLPLARPAYHRESH